MNHIKEARTWKFFIIYEGLVALEKILCYNWDCEPRDVRIGFQAKECRRNAEEVCGRPAQGRHGRRTGSI